MSRYGKNLVHYIIVEHDDQRGQKPIDDDDEKNFYYHCSFTFETFFRATAFLLAPAVCAVREVPCRLTRTRYNATEYIEGYGWMISLQQGLGVAEFYRPWPLSVELQRYTTPSRRSRFAVLTPQRKCHQNEANGQDLSLLILLSRIYPLCSNTSQTRRVAARKGKLSC
ncbi:Utr5p [Saccharomyces cerevisiae YJM1248]|nr:Utr5p [Saccharomyces cerevisiae YJM1248]AJU53159.1 Utr5p [Saccharomyces cerevisiae YJM1439]AJV37325.1 Utr5p [Saccharomyces cerevisiae YJM627]CAD6468769.1 Y55_G0000400.mRNA.1.CDS.1 [Saccharomyces cerevisiae]CAI7279431.1 CBM_collapsed_G0017470.mRNA.1.CDS.1 [Saccharomyces cerevisiae]